MKLKHEKILERLDSTMTRIGSSMIGVNTDSSDFDFATPESVWGKISPLLKQKLGFTEMYKYNHYGDAVKDTSYPSHIMFNEYNVKMEYNGCLYDFVVYKDETYPKVQDAVRKFKVLLDDVPSLVNLLSEKTLRVELFQHFLRAEFKCCIHKTDEELLDDIFAGM